MLHHQDSADFCTQILTVGYHIKISFGLIILKIIVFCLDNCAAVSLVNYESDGTVTDYSATAWIVLYFIERTFGKISE